jgi:hypothetical protein
LERNATDALLILIILVLSVLVFYSVLHVFGPQWDMTARYLEGRTLVNFLTSGAVAHSAFFGELVNNKLYYFEPYREPLAIPIFAVLSLLFQNPMLEYLIVSLIAYAVAICMLGKELKADSLIMFCMFVNLYFVLLFTMNGGEILSLSFAIIGIVYMFRKKPLSGMFLAVATLAKYQSIVLLPLVLLLGDRKKILKAVALEIAVIAVWCVFDYIMYSNPFYSFEQSLLISGIVSTPVSLSAISPIMILSVVAYPVAFAVMGFAYLRSRRLKIKLAMDYRAKVVFSTIILSAAIYLLSLPHNDPITQARYGYLFSMALLIPAAMILGRAVGKSNMLKYSIAAGSIVLLLSSLYIINVTQNTAKVAYYNPDNAGGIYAQAYGSLSALGFGNCRFITNAWVPMLYRGYDAYSPFIAYQNQEISPMASSAANEAGINYTTYTQGVEHYPIIAFKYVGVQSSLILNINESRLAYSGNNFTVYMPQNATCYTER